MDVKRSIINEFELLSISIQLCRDEQKDRTGPDRGTGFGQNQEPNRPGGSTGSRFLPVLVVSSNVGTGPRKIASYGSGFCRFYRFLPVLPVPIISVPGPTGSRF